MQRILAALIVGGWILFLFWTIVKAAEIPSPLTEVRETIERLKKIAGDPSLKGDANTAERREKIRKLIIERMDFQEMAMRSLGRHWRGRTDAEKKEYLEIFSRFMDAFYREQIFSSVEFLSKDARFEYGKPKLEDEYAEILLRIIPKNYPEVKLLIKLRLRNGHWMAYDIVAEDISIVGNWRAQFDAIIRKYSFAGLLERLQQKVKELNR